MTKLSEQSKKAWRRIKVTGWVLAGISLLDLACVDWNIHLGHTGPAVVGLVTTAIGMTSLIGGIQYLCSLPKLVTYKARWVRVGRQWEMQFDPRLDSPARTTVSLPILLFPAPGETDWFNCPVLVEPIPPWWLRLWRRIRR